MTTFKHFTIGNTFVSSCNFRIKIGILIFAFLSYANINAQSNYEPGQKESYKISHSDKVSNHESLPSLHLTLKSGSSEQKPTSDVDDVESRWEGDFVMDQERSDGIDMFLNGTYYQGNSIIHIEIEFLQEGYTILQVFDAFSGELLKSLFEGPTKKGLVKYEIEQKEISVQKILIVATHTAYNGHKITSSLQFDISRTEDIPLGINGSEVMDINAELTPTLGRGAFQIIANFKTNANATVKVYDLTGNLIKTLFTGNVQEGSVTFEGNSIDWVAGNYIVCIHTDRGSWVRKMIVR